MSEQLGKFVGRQAAEKEKDPSPSLTFQGQSPALRGNLVDSGIESSDKTSSYNNEARRLLDPSSGKACCCQQQHRHAMRQQSSTQQQQRHHQQKQQQQPEEIESMSLKAQTIRLLPAYFVAELVGTFLLVLIGDGAIAAYVFTNKPVDAFTVCLSFGVGAMIASYASVKISGAHLNPAATLAFALDSRLKWQLVPVYMVAQYIGGFLAALVLFLNYSEAINSMDGGNHSAIGSTNSTGIVFATYPAPFVTVWGSLIDQIVGTAVLLFSLSAVGDKANLGLEDRFQPPIVALAIGLVCFAFSVNCGAIFNPARDLSPRLLTALLGYTSAWSPIQGTYWIVAGVIGPHIGAIVGVFAYKYLIGTALEASQLHLRVVRDLVAHDNNTEVDISTTTKPCRYMIDPQHTTTEGPHSPHHHHHHHSDNNHHHDAHTPHVQRRSDLAEYGSAIVR